MLWHLCSLRPSSNEEVSKLVENPRSFCKRVVLAPGKEYNSYLQLVIDYDVVPDIMIIMNKDTFSNKTQQFNTMPSLLPPVLRTANYASGGVRRKAYIQVTRRLPEAGSHVSHLHLEQPFITSGEVRS